MLNAADLVSNSYITGKDYYDLMASVTETNAKYAVKRNEENGLGKDEFLKLLIVQLTNQDPTNPMEDKQFIAQMAQFSTLEQTMNLGREMAMVNAIMQRSQAYALLGKNVTIDLAGTEINGVVEEITGSEYPMILVNGTYFDYSLVKSVRTDK